MISKKNAKLADSAHDIAAKFQLYTPPPEIFIDTNSTAFLQSSGLKPAIENNAVTSTSIKRMPIDLSKKYRLVLNSFKANDIDGYSRLTGHHSYVDTKFVNAGDALEAD